MAIIEPSTVAIAVEMAAIFRLSTNASVKPFSLNGSRQLSSVNSCQTRLNRPTGLLNENHDPSDRHEQVDQTEGGVQVEPHRAALARATHAISSVPRNLV